MSDDLAIAVLVVLPGVGVVVFGVVAFPRAAVGLLALVALLICSCLALRARRELDGLYADLDE